MPTLKDVAAEAGVALGTVSRVVNREPSVSPELVARVEKAIQTLDYQPNVLGRNLRRRRSGTIGVVVPDITALFFAELVKQVEKAAMEVGYSVLIGNSANSRPIEDLYLSKLSDSGLDGMVFASSADDDAPVIREGAALVAVDRELSGFDFIASDHEMGAREVVRHLVDPRSPSDRVHQRPRDDAGVPATPGGLPVGCRDRSEGARHLTRDVTPGSSRSTACEASMLRTRSSNSPTLPPPSLPRPISRRSASCGRVATAGCACQRRSRSSASTTFRSPISSTLGSRRCASRSSRSDDSRSSGSCSAWV